MFFIGRKPHDVARPHLFDVSAITLDPAEPRRDDQGLAERMGVPGCTCAGFEGDVRAGDPRRLGRLDQRVDADGSGEPVVRSLAGGLRAVSLDLHIRLLLLIPNSSKRIVSRFLVDRLRLAEDVRSVDLFSPIRGVGHL
jgi:hypothetical protein